MPDTQRDPPPGEAPLPLTVKECASVSLTKRFELEYLGAVGNPNTRGLPHYPS